MATSFDTVYDIFFKRVVNDPDFFQYTNVPDAEVEALMKTNAFDYMIESIATILEYSTPDVDFNDYDDVIEQFNFDLTRNEIQMLANLMFEKFLSRDRASLRIYSKYFTTNEIKLFSPANERNSFEGMLEYVEHKNIKAIKSYNSRDRLTNLFKGCGDAVY